MTSEKLENEAIALIAKYGIFLPAGVKDFFKRLADFNGWTRLKEKL